MRNMQSSRELSVLVVRLQMFLGSTFKHRMAFAFRGFEGNNGNPRNLEGIQILIAEELQYLAPAPSRKWFQVFA